MHAWEAIQSSINRIETNLKEDLTIEELAKQSHLSQYYYQRLFSRLVGKSIQDYIKARRLANAKHALRETKDTILSIALDFGFQSHETFTRSFKELYGITPTQYRTGTMTVHDFLKPDLSMHYTMIDESLPLLVGDMVLEIRKETIIDDIYYTGITQISDTQAMNNVGENTLVTLWHQYLKIKNTITNLKTNGVDIDYFTYASEPGNVMYFVGGESTKEAPFEFYQISLSKGEYYVCKFEAEEFDYLVSDALYKANTYFFEIWLKNKGIGIQDLKPFLFQKYYRFDKNPSIEIWVQLSKKY